ncbi:MAG: DEAD/DEAH box helicase [Phycisphaeraceae bacterium]|nr:DEAD/DEAH box helicase [Phycisphaeraceae bacterium]
MSDLFDTNITFKDFALTPDVLKGVEEMGFVHPTWIQSHMIPLALEGEDVIGQAKTGTGKTAAFGLPLLSVMDPEIPGQALILTPTRELAAQVAGELKEMGRYTKIAPVCIVGGESFDQQMKAIKRGAQIVVGTPGRIMDLQGRGQLKFEQTRFVVLDEVDRMLDIGFRDDIRKIFKRIPTGRQTLFVSATIGEDIDRLARQFMRPDVRRLTIESEALTVSMVDQKYYSVEAWDKRDLLMHLLAKENPDLVVVFCRTKASVVKLGRHMKDKGIEVREIHGDLSQKNRNKVMKELRDNRVRVLLASDLAARGLDVEHITHVINYDLPEDAEIYVHRIGRTARAGRRGVAWSFVTPDEGRLLTAIEKLTGVLIDRISDDDFKPGPVPEHQRSTRPMRGEREPVSIGEMAGRRAGPSVSSDELSPEEMALRFPGGIVPKGPPPKTLGSRFRTRRSR